MSTKKVNVTLRAASRQSATKTIESIRDASHLSLEECNAIIDKLNKLQESLDNLNTKISDEMFATEGWTEEKYLSDAAVEEKYSDSIRYAIAKLQSRIQSLNASNSSIPRLMPMPTPGPSHKISLPNIELPNFDGKPESYSKFIISFENLISKYNLSSFEKFSYLSKQLSGSAKKLIASLSLNDSNYDSAKLLLDKAYSNKNDQQFSVINKLSKLTLSPNASDAFNWIGDARLIEEQIRSLDITVDVFIQYFLLQSMNDEFKKHLVAITNKSYPTLNEIKESMFDANTRYMENHSKKTRETSTSAASVNLGDSRKQNCSLCSYDKMSDTNHKLNHCPKYVDVDARVAKLKSLNGCLKCGYCNHETEKCTYKFFKKCYRCNGSHMSFLCMKSKNSNTTANAVSTSESVSDSVPTHSNTSSHVASVVTLAAKSYNDVVLPTATAYAGSGQNKIAMRVFKDNGSQTTFVKADPSDVPRSKIVGHVDINVEGVNSAKLYSHSPIIDFPIDVPGQGEQLLTAICVPTIGTKINANGLSNLVNKLKSKGIQFADEKLGDNDCIDNISILLGSDNSHIFPITQHSYNVSGNKPSVLSSSPSGFMLSGSVSLYDANMSALPLNLCNR